MVKDIGGKYMEYAITFIVALAIIIIIAAVVVGLKVLLGWGIAEMIDFFLKK